jgi:SAM-dependent methyltransferase
VAPDPAARAWALTLARRSLAKRAKLRQLLALIEPPEGRTSLDIGADNGVVSLVLRERGGVWHSADLDERSVAAIRDLVGTNVHRLDGGPMPFADAAFDQVVVADGLEHVADDRRFVRELARVVAPGGTLVVNVPHRTASVIVPRVKRALGQTDERHGHVRPGYSAAELDALLAPEFAVTDVRTYSGPVAELLDALLNAVNDRRRAAPAPAVPGPTKGRVVTRDDAASSARSLRLLGLIFPALWLVARADALFAFRPGHKLALKARRRPV